MGFGRAVKDVFIVAAKRTPIGAFGGKLMKHTVTELQEISLRAALTSYNINPETIGSVHVGNVIQPYGNSAFMARHASLRVGVAIDTPAQVVNRLCGSGFQAVISAANDITVGDVEVAVAGGAENMSTSPFVVSGATRFGVAFGKNIVLEDSLWVGLSDTDAKTMMVLTAEKLAEQYSISREDADEFALGSQMKWKAAHDAGRFNEELTPVTIKTKKGDVEMTFDEHPRPSTTAENLAKLPSVFKKNGTVTAGNASGICDGAAAIVLASGEACKKHNLTPLARLAGYAIAGVDPTIMGIGPVPAIRNLLDVTGTTMNDMDLVEVNEAFSSQCLAVQRELDVNPEKLNVNGGSVAIGHPVGLSGVRITGHLVHELKRRSARYGVGSACIGSGQGIAVLVESTA